MDPTAHYSRQYAWRDWPAAYEALPPLAGAAVLDLGCALGDQARDLAQRGARVLGVDGNPGFIAHAAARRIPRTAFLTGDIRAPEVGGGFDGLWASFAAAYFPDLEEVLRCWRGLLRPGGWIALTEVADMFVHEPLPAEATRCLQGFCADAAQAGRYDFDMGRKLATHLAAAGFEVATQRVLSDRELAFDGPADPDVLQAWAERFERMPALQARAARECPSLREDFLACLGSASHTTACRVHFVLARA